MARFRGLVAARRAGLAGSVLSAAAASACCLGPIVATLMGVSSLGAFVAFERYRPLFAAAMFACLAGAFYATYRSRPAASCEPGSACATQGPKTAGRVGRWVVWIVAVAALAILTFPTWSQWLRG